jgi:putative transposase
MRVQACACSLAKAEADALNRESGRVYTNVLVWHYRIYRRTGHWLSPDAAQRVEDSLGGPTSLHAHSRDAAQQGFYEACKGARRQQRMGLEMRYPHHRKGYRTTTWKHTGIRVRDGVLLLARARGLEAVRVPLPDHLAIYPASAYKQVELVWDRAARHYAWHLTLEDGCEPAPAPGERVAAVDLGEIHPATLTDGTEAVVICARRLRATCQYTSKRLSALQASQDRKQKGSRRWKRLQRRKNRFLAQQKRRARDLEHKVSRAVVDWAKERAVGTLAVGDVRNVADGKRLKREQQRKISLWSHGRQRHYITYKAQAAGICVVLVDEHHTSKTCPACGHQSKPRGRVYRCPVTTCGFVGHRDAVGSVNILSRYRHGEVGRILPPPLSATMYRHPARVSRQGKRSRLDTPDLARSASVGREAVGL